MIVHLNGEPLQMEDDATVSALLERMNVGLPRRGIAVAVDAQVVPRADWDEHPLSEGARVELLTAIQGGA